MTAKRFEWPAGWLPFIQKQESVEPQARYIMPLKKELQLGFNRFGDFFVADESLDFLDFLAVLGD